MKKMQFVIFVFCLLLFNSNIIANQKVKAEETIGDFINEKIEVINTKTTTELHDIIKLKEPAASISCDKTNGDKIRFMKDIDGYIFFLSIYELLALKVNKENKAELFFVATLLDIDSNDSVIDVQIEKWQDLYMVAVQQSAKLKVYLVKFNKDESPEINHMYKMDFDSFSEKFKIFKIGNDVMLVIYHIREKDANELTFYKWQNSYFQKESSETTNLPSKSDLFVFNENPDYTLVLSIGYGNENESSHVVAFEYDQETNRWLKRQKMYFKKDYIEAYTFDRDLYLIGCLSDSFCAIYKWKDNQFHRQLKISNSIFEIVNSIYSRHNIVIVEDFQNKLSFHSSSEIVSLKPGLLRPKSSEVSLYGVYKSQIQQLYFVEVALNETSILVRFHEIEIDTNVDDERSASNKEIDPIECVLQLKTTLKNRISKVKASEKSAQKLINTEGTFDINKKKFLNANYVKLHGTKVNTLKMPYNVSFQARDLMNQSYNTNVMLSDISQKLKNQPENRDYQFRDGESESNQLESITVQDLVFNGKLSIFIDVLRKSQPIFYFDHQMKLNKISANKLVVRSNKINRIPLDKLLNSTKVKSVTGMKRFQSVKVKHLDVKDEINKIPLTFLKSNENYKIDHVPLIDFNGDINVKHLNVKILNGFNLSALMNDLYVADSQTVINGDLYISSILNVKNLLANHINTVPINNFMTTNTDQVIETDTLISKFHANVIQASSVNNEDITNIALINEDNVIEIPTKFMTISIMKNLNIEDIFDIDERIRASKEFLELVKRHIIGTENGDLSQIYNGQVSIRGSLTFKDVNTFSSRTKIFVNNIAIPQNITENYWMKNVDQQVHVTNFHIDNSLKINGIVTKSLNSHPIEKFLLLDSEKSQGPVLLRFENAIVEGDVQGHEHNHPSMLYQLSKLAVPRNGPSVTISSPVEFRNQLTVKNLSARIINNMFADTLVHKNLHYIKFDGVKAIESAETNELTINKHLTIENYNNVNLEKFLSNAIRIDLPIFLDELKINDFSAYNLTIQEFEKQNFYDLMKNLYEEMNVNVNSRKNKRNIRIQGNVDFKSSIFVDFINSDMYFNEFVDLLAMKKENNQEIGGKKVFAQDVTVKENLESQTINGYAINRLLHRSLSRGDKQTINDNHLFVKNLKVTSLHANKINEIEWNQLISTEKLHLPLAINLDVNEIETRRLTSDSATLDVNEMLKAIRFPKRSQWNYVTVEKGVSMIYGNETYLDDLMNHGVVKSIPQEIYGNVHVLNTPKFYMNKVKKLDSIIFTRTSYVNLQTLVFDAVKNNSPLEIIYGMKTITGEYRLDAQNLIITPQCYLSSSYINEINVNELNRTIHRHGDFLTAEKHFDNLLVEELYIENGLLNGVDPKTIIYVSKNNLQLPLLNLKSLEVGNMQTFSFNGYSFLYLMDWRMRKYGAPQEIQSYITFNSIHLENDTILTSINDVTIDDAVFSSSNQLQHILGHKIVNGRVILRGPAHIANINGVDLTEFYKSTVSLYQDYTSNVPIQLPEIELQNGMRINQRINDGNIDELLSSDAHSPKLKDLVLLIGNVRKKISIIDQHKSMKSANRRMLYVDIDENIDFQFKTPRSRDGDDSDECNNSNELDFKPYSKGVIVSKRSDSGMIVELPSVRLLLNPNFICKDSAESKSINLWWSYAADPEKKYFQNFTFPHEIADVKFMESNSMVFMILACQNKMTSKAEITFLILDDHEWKEYVKLTNFYQFVKMAVIETYNQNSFVVVSTFNENADGDKVIIYSMDSATNQIVISQQPFIGEKFDIILGINVKPKFRGMKSRTFLIFARTNGREIKIYQLKDGTKEFVLHGIIDDFKDTIVEVLVLYINDMPFFIVSQKSGLFCLYELRGIESWVSKYCGRFEKIHQMKSFEYLNRQHLFLATMARNSGPSINALAIYRQGDFL